MSVGYKSEYQRGQSMNTTNKKNLLEYAPLAGIAVALLSGCAAQKEGTISGGLGFAISNTDFKDPSLFQGDQDSSDTGWKVFGRYDPGRRERIVFEGGYQRMGDTTFDGLFQGVSDQGTIETEVVELSVGYRYPLSDKFSAGGRIGAANVDVQEREVFGGVPESSSASETIAYGGVVIRYAFSRKAGLSAHYDHYPDVGKVGATGEGDIGVFGISVDYQFGGRSDDD